MIRRRLTSSVFTAFACWMVFFHHTVTQAQPVLGAEVYLEPGQTPAQINGWMKSLHDAHMPIARVFMMWNYLEPSPGHWDFSLWDSAFDAAQRNGIRIVATLVPNSPPFFWGREYFYRVHIGNMADTKEKRDRSEAYVKQVVAHYRKHPALDTWWLFNEPGQYPTPDSLALSAFRIWLEKKYIAIDSLNRRWLSAYTSFHNIFYDEAWDHASWVWPQSFLDWNRFWREHLNNQIGWLSKLVRSLDSTHILHTNPKNLIDFLAHYDLSGMDRYVDIIGASMHPAWDFSKLPRDRYGLGIAFNNELMGSIARGHPYWVSELQGGNNLYSGFRPLCPSADDIRQWVWTSLLSGADRVIFWSLNGRLQGSEAAEWCMLDFGNKPSGRLQAAAEIAVLTTHNENLFAGLRSPRPSVTVLVSTESMLIQERKQNNHTALQGYQEGMHMKSSLACYMAMMQVGWPVGVAQIENYDWADAKGKTIILADAVALSAADVSHIERFIREGGRLICLGLTGLFDENEKTWTGSTEFPLAKITGGFWNDIQLISPSFFIPAGETKLPVHLWKSLITSAQGHVIAGSAKEPLGLFNRYGNGECVWLPSCIGMGGWLSDLQPLARFLIRNIPSQRRLPFRFDRFYKNCWMKSAITKEGCFTAIFNGSRTQQHVHLISPHMHSAVLYGSGWNAASKTATLEAGKTLLLFWKYDGYQRLFTGL